MRLTKIYTKIGDKGTTLLATGQALAKDAPRIEAYGTVDELNAAVGMLVDAMANTDNCQNLLQTLRTLQNDLFDIGGELSLPNWQEQGIKLQVVTHAKISALETSIDEMNSSLKPLENFVLPRGHVLISASHLCRTICRRAERRVVTLSHSESVRPEVLIFLNRLSDWLFVASRFVAFSVGIDEELWQQDKR